MHILFLTHYFPPEVNAPASRTFEHAREWVKEPGIKVTVITNNPNHPHGVIYQKYKNKLFSNEIIAGINVIRVKTIIASNNKFFWRIFNYLFFMCAAVCASLKVRKPDIIIATSPQFFCAVAGYLTSLLRRKPFVFELRDIWPDSIVTVGAMKRSFAIVWLERLELFLYKKALLIIAVTTAFKTNLIARGIPAEKIVVIKNGADFTFFSPRPPSAKFLKQVNLDGKFVLSYIGTIGMAHAVDKIIEAAELLKDNSLFAFVIVGEGAEKEKVAKLIKQKKLTNVILYTIVTKSEVINFYARSDLCLVTLQAKPLFKTVIPSKIFEIMAMGRPILITVDGEARSIIEEAGSGLFVPPENPSELVKSILELSKDFSLRNQMSANGRKYVISECDRKVLAKRMLLILRSSLSQQTKQNYNN